MRRLAIEAVVIVAAVGVVFALCAALAKIERAGRDAEDKIRRDGACPASRRRGLRQHQPKGNQWPREVARVFRGDGASSGMFCAPTPRVPDEAP